MNMPPKVKLENYRQGYPRLAAFLTLDKNFTIVKRFDNLHMRVLLEQQDKLAELEEQLNHCDDQETIQLNLSSRRQSINQQRQGLLNQIKHELKEYDRAVLDFQRISALPQAQTKHRRSVEHWVNGNKPLVRSESGCILGSLHQEDYIAIRADDPDRGGLETLFDIIVKAYPRLAKFIILFPRRSLQNVAKALVAFIIPIWLICPGVLLYGVSQHRNRAIIYAIFTFGASFMFCFMTNATKYNLLLAVVTYGAVLSAFLSGS